MYITNITVTKQNSVCKNYGQDGLMEDCLKLNGISRDRQDFTVTGSKQILYE